MRNMRNALKYYAYLFKMELTIKEITSAFPAIKVVGNADALVKKIIQLDLYNNETDILCWCNAKNLHNLNLVKSGTVIIPAEGLNEQLDAHCNYIVVENPRQYFNNVLTKFFWDNNPPTGISSNAEIHTSSTTGKSVYIGNNVIVKENCIIGNNVQIHNNTIIHANTVIEDNVIIGANSIIGNYGFGYEKNTEGNYILMPHIGNVIIKSFAEIGSNCCVDRSVLGSTIVGEYTKIHNFVQVAHGVQIGKNCLVTANVTISGGTTIGSNVWVGPAVTITNKINIGDSVYLSIGCVVVSDVPAGATVIGNPGRIIKTNNQ